MQLEILYAALDQVESGLLILNRDFHAIYCNAALLKMFKSHRTPETLRREKPHYQTLLEEAAQDREGRRLHYDRSDGPDIAPIETTDYVTRRLDWLRSGDPKPVDLKMNNGAVLRCKLTALPDGGRVLVYSEITDIIGHAKELEQLATVDAMTGTFNRRHFLKLADREWTRAQRYSLPLALMLLDIDCFKSINDRFGHPFGDAVLVHVATLANRSKRETDVFARIGGEEFALLLPQTTIRRAQVVAERLRKRVADNALTAGNEAVSSTVSIGIAERTADVMTFSQLMSSADKALYEAKRAGRNRVACSTFSMRASA
jgi:diguanylate cyclase (GGDEF)-like protein